MTVQGRGNTDSDKVHVPDKAEIRGGAEHAGLYQRFQVSVYHVTDIVLPSIHQVDFFLLHIKANGFETVLGFVNSQRQSHIAQAADAHGHGLALDLLNQFCFDAHVNRSP